jgi:hypothetical protein
VPIGALDLTGWDPRVPTIQFYADSSTPSPARSPRAIPTPFAIPAPTSPLIAPPSFPIYRCIMYANFVCTIWQDRLANRTSVNSVRGMRKQNAGARHQRGMTNFGSAVSSMEIGGGLEGEDTPSRQDRECGEGDVEVVLDVCQVPKNLRCKLCSRNNRRAWLGKGEDSTWNRA